MAVIILVVIPVYLWALQPAMQSVRSGSTRRGLAPSPQPRWREGRPISSFALGGGLLRLAVGGTCGVAVYVLVALPILRTELPARRSARLARWGPAPAAPFVSAKEMGTGMNSVDNWGTRFGHFGDKAGRMVFFRWTRPGLPDFLRAHLREQFRSMEQFFDVFEVDWECDYGQVCASLRPDLCVFESGVYAGERTIGNTSSHPEIPKLGFLHADAFDSSRAAFVADMARWGVNWFFTTSMSMAEYTPEIAERLFVWPNAVDPEVFRDYGLSKNIPMLLTGSQARHYPWRNAISRTVMAKFPTMTMPHFGWNGEAGTARMLHGADYARLINASLLVPACGTICKDIVRKHLEIPAFYGCLVTERSRAVESFGFADMVNCVFADESDIGSKLDHLLTNREELDRITRAGHDLVHERHSVRQRDQVRQWFDLVSSTALKSAYSSSGPWAAHVSPAASARSTAPERRCWPGP